MKDYKVIREDGTFEILKHFKGGRWDAINTVRCRDKNQEYARLDDVDAAVEKDAALLRTEEENKLFECMKVNKDSAYWLENNKIIEISIAEYNERLNKFNKGIENLYKKSFIVKSYEVVFKFIRGIWWKIDWFLFGHIRKKHWERLLNKYYKDRSISSVSDW